MVKSDSNLDMIDEDRVTDAHARYTSLSQRAKLFLNRIDGADMVELVNFPFELDSRDRANVWFCL